MVILRIEKFVNLKQFGIDYERRKVVPVGEAKSGVDIPPALLPLRYA
ncbi:hypothetical protein [Tolypothrix sp. VBCCA 56010]